MREGSKSGLRQQILTVSAGSGLRDLLTVGSPMLPDGFEVEEARNILVIGK